MCNRLACPQPLFTGKERDAESGNDYFGVRYYASSMGRWLSPDWSVKAEPVPYAKLDNPQSLNLYAYVLNRPLTGVDPDGHSCKDTPQLCKAIMDAMSKGMEAAQAMRSSAQQLANQVGSYFYGKGFKGSGDQLHVEVLGVKVEAGKKEGKEVTQHLNGDREEKEVKSNMHIKVEVGPLSGGIEREVSGDQPKSEWHLTGGWKGIEGEGGQVGVDYSFCHSTCSSLGFGVEAGKAVNDFRNWLNELPDSGPFSYKNK